MYFNYAYNYQRVLYEDPKKIEMQFILVQNIKVKYNIIDTNLYNFNKIRFIIDIIILLFFLKYITTINKMIIFIINLILSKL